MKQKIQTAEQKLREQLESEKKTEIKSPGLNQQQKMALIQEELFQEERLEKLKKSGKRNRDLLGNVLDYAEAGIELPEKAADKLPVIAEEQEDAAELADKESDVLLNVAKTTGKIKNHMLNAYSEKKVVKKEIKRGTAIGKRLQEMGEKGEKARAEILKGNEKPVWKIEKKAYKINRSQSRKLEKDLKKINSRYDKRIRHADSPQRAKEQYRSRGLEQIAAGVTRTERTDKKTKKAVYKKVKKYGGLESAAVIAASSSMALDNQVNRPAFKKTAIKEVSGIKNGNLMRVQELEKSLGIRAGNIGMDNRISGITPAATRSARKSVAVFGKMSAEDAAERFMKKQERITGKKLRHLTAKKQHRKDKLENKAALRKARMDFVIKSILEDEQETEQIAGVELVKRVFFIHGTSALKKMAEKSGQLIFFIIGGIVQLFVSLFILLFSMLLTFLVPALLIGVCVLTIYSAIAWIGGFFNFGDGKGVVTVASSEVNLTQKANILYGDLNDEINAYLAKSRVKVNTEKEYVEETYEVTYPCRSSPAKGDLLADYFTKLADEKAEDITEDELLPYMNVNTYREQTALNTVFNQMNYFGAETYSESSTKTIIGYEQKKVVKTVLSGYEEVVTNHTVNSGDAIYNTGAHVDTGTGSCYVRLERDIEYEAECQLSEEELDGSVMYGFLNTTTYNKIPLGSIIYLDYTYLSKRGKCTVTFPVQIIGIDTSGKNLYNHYPNIKIYTNTMKNFPMAKRIAIAGAIGNITKSGQPAVLMTNMRSMTGYEYTTKRYNPVYTDVESWEPDYDKPIYKTYTYKKYSKPVYYLSAEEWYAAQGSSFTENQTATWNICKDLYKDVSY